MELFPELQLGWLNGWIPLAAFYLVFILLLRLFPQDVVRRLYDRSGWTQEQRILGAVGLPFALAGLVLIIFTPLKMGQPVFLLGSAMYGLGLVGFVTALFDFRNTPPDRPVTGGLYKYSRNPQWVTFATALLGTSVAVGSWSAFLLLGVRVVFNHFRILGEERSCLKQYGDVYGGYMESVPRYLSLF